jgi:3-mercaptopyruvate sulfurtransferase SseA
MNTDRKLSRRHIAVAGMLSAAVATIAPNLSRPANARVGSQFSTPSASPLVASRAYGRPSLLVDPGSIAAGHQIVALTPARDFAAAHLPEARQLDWPELEVTDTSDESIAQWAASMRDIASSFEASTGRIIAYDGGTLFAPRLWWVLFYLGYPEAQVLNGGLAAWTSSGGAVVKGNEPSAPTPAVGATSAAVRRGSLATLRDVEGAIGTSDVILLDVRAKDEYVAGHVPGAINLAYTLNAEDSSPHRWKSANDLTAMYAAIGVTPNKTIVPYCSTGVRSAVTFFTLWLLGFDQVALYTGSWAEWGKNPTTPKRTGDRP